MKTSPPVNPDGEDGIVFTLPNVTQNSLVKRNLLHRIASHEINIYDFLHQKRKNYRAFAMEDLLKAGFGQAAIDLANFQEARFLLTTTTGGTDTATIAQVFTLSGYLAFEDLDVEGEENWETIAQENNCSPAPFYLVWADSSSQSPLNNYPWAYKLKAIDIIQ